MKHRIRLFDSVDDLGDVATILDTFRNQEGANARVSADNTKIEIVDSEANFGRGQALVIEGMGLSGSPTSGLAGTIHKLTLHDRVGTLDNITDRKPYFRMDFADGAGADLAAVAAASVRYPTWILGSRDPNRLYDLAETLGADAGFKLLSKKEKVFSVDLYQGADTFVGSDGRETIYAGLSYLEENLTDRVDGKGGSDTISFQQIGTAVNVDLALGIATWTRELNETAYNREVVIENVENLQGADAENTLKGDGAANQIVGGQFADKIQGHGGDDILVGNYAIDSGDRGRPEITPWWEVFAEDEDHDVIKGGTGNDRIQGYFGDDRLFGGPGRDVIVGGGDDDQIFGGAHSDRIEGQAGNDRLIGGGGRDVFIYGKFDDVDLIGDFEAGRDVIHLDVFGINRKSDVRDVAAAKGADLVLDFGDGDVLTIAGVRLKAIIDDFEF